MVKVAVFVVCTGGTMSVPVSCKTYWPGWAADEVVASIELVVAPASLVVVAAEAVVVGANELVVVVSSPHAMVNNTTATTRTANSSGFFIGCFLPQSQGPDTQRERRAQGTSDARDR
jgi:hypothetical protein